MQSPLEKLKTIIAWAEGAEPTDAVRNIAVLAIDDARSLLAYVEQQRAASDALAEAAETIKRDKDVQWYMHDSYHDEQRASVRIGDLRALMKVLATYREATKGK